MRTLPAWPKRVAPEDPEIQQRMDVHDALTNAFEVVNRARLLCKDTPGLAGYADDLRRMQDELNNMCQLA